jgi:precorrin-3B synthase
MPGPSAATAEIVPLGACPTARRPFVAADGLLVRVRVAGGELTVARLRAVAAAADRHGNGVVELTSRANVQLRGVRPEALATLVAELVAAGLLPADEADEPRCDVVVPPTAGLDPSEPVDVRAIAADLRARLAALAATTIPDRWPPKAAIVVDGGGFPSLRGRPADVGLAAVRRTDTGAVAVELAVATPLPPDPTGPPGATALVVAPRHAAAAAAGLVALAVRAPASATSPGGGGPTRVRDLVAEHGLDAVIDRLRATLPSPALDDPPVVARVARTHLVSVVGRPAGPRSETGLGGEAPAGAPLGRIGPAGDGTVAIGAAAPLGRLDGRTLAALADALAEAGVGGPQNTGDDAGAVRVTPWRSVLVPAVPGARVEVLVGRLAALGFVLDAADPAAAVVACAGSVRCAAGHAEAEADGHRLIAHLRATAPAAGSAPVGVHLSGCAKRCASRAVHDVTFVGTPGGGYDAFVRDPGAPDGERLVRRWLRPDDVPAWLAARTALPAADPTAPGGGR